MKHQSAVSDEPKSTPLAALAFLCSCQAICLTIFAAYQMGSTYDEYAHWNWSHHLYYEGNTNRTDAVNRHSNTPINLLNVAIVDLVNGAGFYTEKTLFLKRLPSVLWLVGILIGSGLLAKRLRGNTAGFLAVVFCSLDPNIISHSALVTVDAAFTFTVLVSCLTLLLFLEKPRLQTALSFGAAAGLAFVAKFTAILLLPAFLLSAVLYRRLSKRHCILLGSSVIAFLIVLNCSYFFIGVGKALDPKDFNHTVFQVFASLLHGVWQPFPYDFLTGIDMSLTIERAVTWEVPLLNRFHSAGVWYYFLVNWILKTPVFLIAAIVIGVLLAIKTKLLVRNADARAVFVFIVVFVCYFSFVFRTMIGFRYVLMCLPLLYALAAVPLSQKLSGRFGSLAIVLLCLTSSAELLVYRGNPLSFTNALVQPKSHAFKLTADSNLNWGQNDHKLETFRQDNAVPKHSLNPFHIQPGRNLIDGNHVMGVHHNKDQFHWLRNNLMPIGHAEFTHILYTIDGKDFYTFLRDEREAFSLPIELLECQQSKMTTLLHSRSGELKVQGSVQRICLIAETDSVLRIRNQGKLLAVWPKNPEGECRPLVHGPLGKPEVLERHMHSWFAIAPGTSEFCIRSDTDVRFGLRLYRGAIRFVVE